jgi:hypothetical protein
MFKELEVTFCMLDSCRLDKLTYVNLLVTITTQCHYIWLVRIWCDVGVQLGKTSWQSNIIHKIVITVSQISSLNMFTASILTITETATRRILAYLLYVLHRFRSFLSNWEVTQIMLRCCERYWVPRVSSAFNFMVHPVTLSVLSQKTFSVNFRQNIFNHILPLQVRYGISDQYNVPCT